MPGPNSPYTQLDADQVIQRVFEESQDRLRVDAEITAVVSGPFEVAIDDTTDSIKIGDGSGTYLDVNPDGSLNNRIRDSNGAAITLGQKTKAQSVPVVLPSDQPISVTFPPDSTVGTIESGTVSTAYNEVTAVATSVLTTIVSYVCPGDARMKFVEMSGTNIATYTILINGIVINKKRTYFGNMDGRFDFTKGYILATNDLVEVQVIHTQPSVGDFNAFILTLIDV